MMNGVGNGINRFVSGFLFEILFLALSLIIECKFLSFEFLNTKSILSLIAFNNVSIVMISSSGTDKSITRTTVRDLKNLINFYLNQIYFLTRYS